MVLAKYRPILLHVSCANFDSSGVDLANLDRVVTGRLHRDQSCARVK